MFWVPNKIRVYLMETNMMHYAVKYWDTPETTTMTQNPITGNRDIACDIFMFATYEGLQKWLNHDPYFKKKKVTQKELRKHRLGTSVYDYEEELRHLETSDGEL